MSPSHVRPCPHLLHPAARAHAGEAPDSSQKTPTGVPGGEGEAGAGEGVAGVAGDAEALGAAAAEAGESAHECAGAAAIATENASNPKVQFITSFGDDSDEEEEVSDGGASGPRER